MCGFSGFISSSLSPNKFSNILKSMGQSLAPRGPDEEGFWICEDSNIGFAHRRLAVIELGPGGQQPMFSSSGRYVLVFNGEIYNQRVLRAELELSGIQLNSQSDTEVLLVALENWGYEQTLTKIVGMFAFAIWDRKKRSLFLSRDRFGEKPLYYGWQGGSFLFGSTLHALKQHTDWLGKIDRQALYLLSQYNYIPAPHSIYEGIQKLEPGMWFELTWENGDWQERIGTYWSALSAAERGRANPFLGSFQDASDILENSLQKIIEQQMLADVPLGAFLSGGIDSSAIVALMQSQSSQPVRTYTIGFDNPAYDESSAAEAVAKKLGTSHTTCQLKETDIFDLIFRLPNIYDEPFADASQLPTALVSQIARRDVTVALTGDGGDEIFGGYNRYIWGEGLKNNLNRLPLIARIIAGNGIRLISPSIWDNILNFIPASRRLRHGGEKLHKLANLASANSPQELYCGMTTFWADGLPVGETKLPLGLSDESVWNSDFSFTEQMMLADTLTYLPDDILVKVDRAAMAVGLETRAPFLNHQLFEFSWSLPLSYRIKGSRGKSLLRDVLHKHVPKDIVERPKSGFALPISDYLRGPLRDWAEALLDRNKLSQGGYFNPEEVHNAWEQHLSGKFNRQYDLWSVLMFQAWLES